MKVDAKTLEELEFYTFINFLKELTFSPYGRKYFDNLDFEVDPEKTYAQVKELESIFIGVTSLISKTEDMTEPLKSVISGKKIDSKELIDFGELFKISQKLNKILLSTSSMIELANELTPSKGFIEFCDKTFNPDGSIKDNASSELVHIRKELRSIEQSIDDKIKKLIADGIKANYISEGLVVQRHDRYVLPVDASKRSSVKGIIHGQSSTGLTYYIEPEEMIELNDALAITRSKETTEISKIINTGIDLILKNADTILRMINAMQKFDALYARASYGIKNSCCIPVINKEGFIKIEKGRNPLIPEKKVIPVDVEIEATDRVIIVSGPNMGGKTAFLKTVGLFSLMCALGIPIPAKNGTELSVFDSVRSDIGDSQSVTNELSTFSARVIRENEICNLSNENSLILIDEIGEGTEPSEGVAFGRSILDILISKDAKTIVTTHLPDLKSLAYTVKNVRNASVGFDVEKMEPTYRIYMDMPGMSRALEIIEKIGVSDEIIDNFKKYRSIFISKGDMLIEELQSKIYEYDEKVKDVNLREDLLNEREKDYESRFEKLKSKEISSLSSEITKLSEKLAEIKKEIEESIHTLRSSNNEAELAAQRKKIEELRKSLENHDDFKRSDSEFDAGSYAKIKGTDVIGRVKAVKKDYVTLDVDGSNVEISLQMIEKAEEVQKNSREQEKAEYVKSATISNEIDIRGMTVEDAIPIIDEFVERVIRSNSAGLIIHGKGTGKLANGIWSFLRSKHVNFRIGHEGEGGTGVTIIGE